MFTYLLIAINVIVSLIGFSKANSAAGVRLSTFSPYEVSSGRGYAGMVLSHFSHADGMHLFFNMMTFYYFGPVVENFLGWIPMLIIYIVAGIASTVFVYYRHRSDPGYRALGASDSVTGILFAAIVLDPSMTLLFFIVPIPIPAPIFAVLYVVISTYLMRRGEGHISHEAHLAGAFAGLVLSGMLSPRGFAPLLRELRDLVS